MLEANPQGQSSPGEWLPGVGWTGYNLKAMNNRFDLKSLVCGLSAGVLLTLGMGAALSPSMPVQRYQCSASDVFLMVVDTATGRTWAMAPTGVSITGAPTGFFDQKVDR